MHGRRSIRVRAAKLAGEGLLVDHFQWGQRGRSRGGGEESCALTVGP